MLTQLQHWCLCVWCVCVVCEYLRVFVRLWYVCVHESVSVYLSSCVSGVCMCLCNYRNLENIHC